MTNKEKLQSIFSGKIYADEDVLNAVPYTKPKGELEFFTVGTWITMAELEEEYVKRGLIPANVYQLAAWCEAHRSEKRDVGTQWKDADSAWCCAVFGRWVGERLVCVRRDGYGWDDFWWFAGLRNGS